VDDRTPGYDERDFGDYIATTREHVTAAEFDDLIETEQNATAEPFEGRT
jgi:hypothetical protein